MDGLAFLDKPPKAAPQPVYALTGDEEFLKRQVRDRLQELLDHTVRSTVPAEVKLRKLIRAAVHVILDELHGTALLVDLEALTPAHRRAVIHRRDRFDVADVPGLAAVAVDGQRPAGQPRVDERESIRRREQEATASAWHDGAKLLRQRNGGHLIHPARDIQAVDFRPGEVKPIKRPLGRP